MSSWSAFHDARALCFGAHREHQFGELGLALGLNPHCDTCFSHQFVGVFRREVGHRRIKLLGTFQIDVAALYVNVGMNAQSHVVAVFQLDGEAHRQEMRGSLAEVFEYRSGHLLGNQRVLVCNLAGESYLVATRCLFVGGYRLPIHAERLYAVVQTNLVFYHLISAIALYHREVIFHCHIVFKSKRGFDYLSKQGFGYESKRGFDFRGASQLRKTKNPAKTDGIL